MAIQALSQEPCYDAISRQAVINAIENDCMRGGLGSCFACYNDAQAFRGEIEKLPSVTQKPNFCASCKHNTDNEICLECEYDGITRGMTRYESVTQKSGTGHWIKKEDDTCWWYACSECEQEPLKNRWNDDDVLSAFCPNCGCRMVEPQESEE